MVSSRHILVLGNGALGAEKQALSLASKLQSMLNEHPHYAKISRSVAIAMSRVPYRPAFQHLPPLAHIFLANIARNPWLGYLDQKLPIQNVRDDKSIPDIVIGCGRSTVALCAGYKRAYPSIFNIQMQHPRCVPTRYIYIYGERDRIVHVSLADCMLHDDG
jgi:mitochondrial fission protein ELM1